MWISQLLITMHEMGFWLFEGHFCTFQNFEVAKLLLSSIPFKSQSIYSYLRVQSSEIFNFFKPLSDINIFKFFIQKKNIQNYSVITVVKNRFSCLYYQRIFFLSHCLSKRKISRGKLSKIREMFCLLLW